MKIHKHIVFYILVAVFFTATPSFAKELSDDQAFGRAYTVCSQRVYPLWRSKEGETVNRDHYALTPARLQVIAACMRDRGVPAAFDEETFGVVRTGAGFGENVNVKIEDIFPDDIAVPRDSPHRTQKNILPDPGYSPPENTTPDAAGYDEIDARLMRELKSGEMLNKKSDIDLVPPEIRRRESQSYKRPPTRSEAIGVISGNKNDRNNGNDSDVKPIFLPR